MAKIESELNDPKNLKAILDQSVKDVERMSYDQHRTLIRMILTVSTGILASKSA